MDESQNEHSAAPANGGTTGALREAAQARTSRRNMLRRGGVAAVATVAGLTLLDQRRAEAATGGNFLLGEANTADATTSLAVTTNGTLLNPLFHVSAAGLTGTSTTMVVDGPGAPAGRALVVNGNGGGTGIITSAATTNVGTVGLALAASGSNGADAIHAASDKGSAIVATSTTGRGVLAKSTSNAGVSGGSATGAGVAGTSGTGAGVTGKGHIGGLFNGSVANLRLIPQAGAHPASGGKGDLFVDHNAHLWFCRGGTTWVKLA
jgi:hypothetical protein